ncbi:hypothetical protein MLD38_007671 [Melastoma candidum]|uniref:Uncharacterized protein n=1 Tax=Melastoma candidum TaxID=119954 RepID=A0ACB9RTR4_9MYRT|nr:hypothetical protein MLD38_007671 [Melastoma candidum]
MPPKRTCAAGPRPFRRSVRNTAATATPFPPSTSPKTPELAVADRKSYSVTGFDAGDSSVEPSPCSLIQESCRDGPEVKEAGVEELDPGFGGGDLGGRGTDVVADRVGGCSVEGPVSVVEEKGEGSGVRRKRIVRRIVKVVKVVKKRVPKKEVVEGRGEGPDGAKLKKEGGKFSEDVPVAQNGNDCVATEVGGDNGGRVINSNVCADLSVRVEGLISGDFNEGDAKDSGGYVDSSFRAYENVNADIGVASAGLPVGFETSIHGKDYEGDVKEVAVEEDRGRDDRQRIESGNVVSLEGMNKDAVIAGSDRFKCSDNVISSASSVEEADGDTAGSSIGSKDKINETEGGLLWTGEMEALERKRRRKTEIFIGGLAKDASENDVWKVFEEVGEVVNVRIVKHNETGKSKGYAFLRYAAAADAKKALEKFHKVEICGKECGTRPVEGNDTIFLGNINKQWKEVDVIKLLEGIGVHKIDTVTVMTHPIIADQNRGFAFVELESNKDADVAFKKLQKQDKLGKLGGIKVAWARPLNEPDEEEMQKVKSVYAEFIPSSWNEGRVREYFKKFGEIEKVTLSRNMPSSKRKDFAFVNFRDREAAVSCIQSLKNELVQDGSEVNLKVSLARPVPKSSLMKKASYTVSKSKPAARETPKPSQRMRANHRINEERPATSTNYLLRLGESTHSRTAEAVQFLREREQTSWMLSQTRLASGSPNLDIPYTLSGSKRPLSIMETDPLYSDFRGHNRARIDNAYPPVVERPGPFSLGSRMTSLARQQPQSSVHPFAHHYLDPGSSYRGPVMAHERGEAPFFTGGPLLYRYQYH